MARHERIIGTRIELCGVMKVQKCIEQNASEHGGSLKCVAADSNTTSFSLSNAQLLYAGFSFTFTFGPRSLFSLIRSPIL